jgi:hypothetical protein
MEKLSTRRGFSFQRLRQREERMLVRVKSLIRRRMEERRLWVSGLIRSI